MTDYSYTIYDDDNTIGSSDKKYTLYKLYNLKEKKIDYDFSKFQTVKPEKKVEKKKIYKN